MANEKDVLKLENQLSFPLYVCAKELVRRYTHFLRDLDLTYTQYITMIVLWEKREVNVKDLGESLYLDSGTLTPLLKKLEEKGYVTRNHSKQDERVLVVKLTKAGADLREKASLVPSKVGEGVRLSKAEEKQLTELLYRLIGNMKN